MSRSEDAMLINEEVTGVGIHLYCAKDSSRHSPLGTSSVRYLLCTEVGPLGDPFKEYSSNTAFASLLRSSSFLNLQHSI